MNKPINKHAMKTNTLTPKQLRRLADENTGVVCPTLEVMTAICEAQGWWHSISVRETGLKDKYVHFSYLPGTNAKRMVIQNTFITNDMELSQAELAWDHTITVGTGHKQALKQEFHEHVARIRKACLRISRKGSFTPAYTKLSVVPVAY